MQRPAVSPLIGCALLAVFMAACDGSTEPPVPTTIHLEPAAVELAWGGSAPVTAEVRDQHGKRIDDWPQGFNLDWTIDKPSIAIVEEGIRTSSIRSTFKGGGSITLTVASAGIPPAQAAITALSAPDSIAGEMAFQYQGDHTGTFVVDGAWPFDHQDPKVVHAREYVHSHGGSVASYYNPGQDHHIIAATRVRPNGWEDRFHLRTAGRIAQPGTYELSSGSLYLGWRHDSNFVEVEASYDHLGTGSLTITSAGPDHVTGTFELTLRDQSADPWARLETVEGHFQAPRLMDLPWQ